MDLQLSVFLLFILFAGGHSLSCYDCTSLAGSCAGEQVRTCPELSTCFSSTVVALIDGNTTKAKIKGCVPSNACLYSSFSSADFSSFCCNTDLCNAKDAELSGDSSPDIFNISNVLNDPSISNVHNISNGPNPPIPNGMKCYYCIGQSCLNIMDCSGSQDRCLKGTVTNQGQTFAVNGCATKEVCDSVASFTCCEGNLCNGAQSVTQSSTYNSAQSVTQSSTYNSAQSVTQSFLFLCCSLLSYFLLH